MVNGPRCHCFSQGFSSRAAVEADRSLYSNQFDYNKYKAKSVVLALAVLDQVSQKYKYLTVWMLVVLYG